MQKFTAEIIHSSFKFINTDVMNASSYLYIFGEMGHFVKNQ
jgi:hypothetical protein